MHLIEKKIYTACRKLSSGPGPQRPLIGPPLHPTHRESNHDISNIVKRLVDLTSTISQSLKIHNYHELPRTKWRFILNLIAQILTSLTKMANMSKNQRLKSTFINSWPTPGRDMTTKGQDRRDSLKFVFGAINLVTSQIWLNKLLFIDLIP